MKKGIFIGLAALLCVNIFAQEQQLLNLRLEARGDYQREYVEGSTIDGNTGFKGKFLNLRVDGAINEEFSYSYRQRFNKANDDSSFFDATDWLYLTYKKNNWELSAGKQVVAIGGYEYDLAPIDLFFCSEWWQNIPCYQWGGSVAYNFGGNDKMLLQLCESPFRDRRNQEDMYAFNLMWMGSHGWFNTLYSVNMIEYLPGKYINYISLGNKFNFGDFSIELDLMNRAASGQAFIGKDYSVIGKFAWCASDKLNLFAKASHDVNECLSGKDFLVAGDTKITRVGAGVEFYPLKDGKNDIRIHAVGSYSFGDDANASTVLLDNQTFVTVGVTWKMDLLSFKR